MVGAGFYLYLLIPADYPNPNRSLFIAFLTSATFSITVGVPWILVAQWLADTVSVGSIRIDADEEWLGRGDGWLLVTAIIWFFLTIVTFTAFIADVEQPIIATLIYLVLPTIVLTGFVTAVTGRNLFSLQTEARGAWVFVKNLLWGGPGCLNGFSASISGASAVVRLPSGGAAE